ncbi:MAG: transcriptional regulator, partial [Spirochaetaceae bacterium]
MSDFTDNEAREDFNRARMHEVFSGIFHILNRDKRRLLSLDEVKEVVRPRGETYRGMQTVPISRIVGSEGRYRDFNKGFLPKHERLRGRWTSIDRAHLQDVILPAIKLYEIGGVYFVRDGNHRVSVAKAQGVMAIDAEVTSLDSEIELPEDITQDKLRKAVIEHERKLFHKRTGFERLV